MAQVNIFEAKTHLSKLLELAEKGEDVIIARAGKPVARLTRLGTVKKPILYGALRGKIRIGENFDDPLAEDFLIAPGA